MDYLGRSHFDLAADAAAKNPPTAEALAAALREMAQGLRDLEKQAQQMQQSGAGMVKVLLSGKGDLRRVAIDPSLLSADEKEVLEDLLVAAHADAKQKVEATMAEEMQKATAGLNIPGGLGGLKLPF